MNSKVMIYGLVLVAFGGWTAFLVAQDGYTAWIELALRERWGAQMLLDLGISLALFSRFAAGDAKSKGIPIWPYLIGMVLLGSPAALAYMIHRELKSDRLEPAVHVAGQ